MVIPGFKGMSLGRFARTLFRQFWNDAVLDTAAQLSYYFLFALFPFLFFLVTLAAYLPIGPAVEELLARMSPLVPKPAMALLDTHLRALVFQPRPKLLTSAIVSSIWAASRG